jgi:hypothetical protein
MNSMGVLYPKLECGRTSLKCLRHASIITLACARLYNQFIVKHSSLNLPLKPSSVPFCQGLPGAISKLHKPFGAAHCMSASLTNSGQLSLQRTKWQPRSSINCSDTAIRCWLRIQPAASMHKLSLLNSSTTIKHFSFWPLAQPSNTKCIPTPDSAPSPQRTDARYCDTDFALFS